MDNILVFTIILAVWFSVGFIGVLNAKADRINYEMAIFFLFIPFIPIIAYFLGIS